MNIAVYPGSFDPCTNGHLDVIQRASKIFDKVIVAVLCNSRKTPLFSAEERIELIIKITKEVPCVEVITFSGLLVDCMKKNNAKIVIKGLRAVSDFEDEFQMALTNRKLCNDLETLFIPTSAEYMFLSSSIVKEVASYNGDLTGLVPDELIPVIKSRFGFC